MSTLLPLILCLYRSACDSGKCWSLFDTLLNVLSFFSQQICVPKADEWTRFVRTLAEINENRDEAEELANV